VVSTERVRSLGGARGVFLFFAAAACLLAFGCGEGDDVTPEAGAGSDAPNGSGVEAATGDSINAASAASDGGAIPVLLDLGADKCVPCKMMAPILEEMRETFAGQLDVRFVDVWKDASAAREYDVKVIPTQIFFDPEGNELFRHQGFFSREDMLAKWREFGFEFGE
jgi:thioredoxin 1